MKFTHVGCQVRNIDEGRKPIYCHKEEITQKSDSSRHVSMNLL